MRCEGYSAGLFAQQVTKGMSWLSRNEHPRWKQVDLDLDAPIKGWEQSPNIFC